MALVHSDRRRRTHVKPERLLLLAAFFAVGALLVVLWSASGLGPALGTSLPLWSGLVVEAGIAAGLAAVVARSVPSAMPVRLAAVLAIGAAALLAGPVLVLGPLFAAHPPAQALELGGIAWIGHSLKAVLALGGAVLVLSLRSAFHAAEARSACVHHMPLRSHTVAQPHREAA